MSTPRPLPTKIGTLGDSQSKAHLAFADAVLFCDETRSLTGKATGLSSEGPEAIVAALLDLEIDPGRVCRRCLRLPQFHDRYAQAWAARTTSCQVRIDRPDYLAPQATALLEELIQAGIAQPDASGAVRLDVGRTAAFLHPILDRPVGTGGDRTTGALMITGALNRNGQIPEPAHKPVPGVTGPAEHEPGTPLPITGGLVESARRIATGEQQDGTCFDCSRAYVRGQQIVVLRTVNHPSADPITLHTHCVDLRARAWDDPDRADRWTVQPGKPAPHLMVVNGGHATRVPVKPGDALTIVIDDVAVVGIDLASGGVGVWPDGEQWVAMATLPGYTAPTGTGATGAPFDLDMVGLRAENEHLAARCAQLETEAQLARQDAAAAGGMCDAQAASLAELARMAEAVRCHNAELDHAPVHAAATEADRLLVRRQAVLARAQALWDRANALEEGVEPPQDADTAQDEDYDHGDAQKARWHAEDYAEQNAGVLDALLGHIERTGQIPTAWRTPLPGSATADEVARYAASLAVPESGGHVITQQFIVTMRRLPEDRWALDPSCLYGDGIEAASEPVHDDDCPCDQRVSNRTINTVLDEIRSAPTPGQLADSIAHAYEMAATPAG